MRARVARAAAAASSAASAEVNTHASKAQTIVSRTRRMRRLCAEGEEATFIVDIEFKRINPLLQIQRFVYYEHVLAGVMQFDDSSFSRLRKRWMAPSIHTASEAMLRLNSS